MSAVLAHQSHSETSLAAAIAYAGRATTARERVFRLLEGSSEGLTDEELQTLLGMSANTQRPRRVELERAGLVQDSGLTRETSAGMLAVVWVVTGKTYPHRWPSPRVEHTGLQGDAKALFEIQQAIPTGKRSPELKALLSRLQDACSSLRISDSGNYDSLDDYFS